MSQDYSNIVAAQDGCYQKLYEEYKEKYREADAEAKAVENDIADFCEEHATITDNGTYTINEDNSFEVDVATGAPISSISVAMAAGSDGSVYVCNAVREDGEYRAEITSTDAQTIYIVAPDATYSIIVISSRNGSSIQNVEGISGSIIDNSNSCWVVEVAENDVVLVTAYSGR